MFSPNSLCLKDLSVFNHVWSAKQHFLTSIGAPGTPGVSIAILLVTIAAKFGIPTSGMVLILGVDRILDMCRTVVNVTGDLMAAVLLRYVGVQEM